LKHLDESIASDRTHKMSAIAPGKHLKL